MFWWILIGVSGFLLILGIIGICVYIYTTHCAEWIYPTSCIVAWVFGVIFAIAIILVPVQKVRIDKTVEIFKQQKYYIEEVAPTLSETDNYALTQKRIELNQWLYNAQYEMKHYGFFTLYPNEVLKLEEIK